MLTIGDLQTRGIKPRFHGNGFTQIYLNPRQRLHVWHPSLPMQPNNNATVHDHIWDMHSQVLHGRVMHRSFRIRDRGEFDLYEINQDVVRGLRDGDFHNLVVAQIGIEQNGEVWMSEGSEYSLPHGYLHENTATGIAVTLMTKGEDKMPLPHLVCPTGETPRNAFDPAYQPSEAHMWRAIKDGLVRLHWQQQHMIKNTL